MIATIAIAIAPFFGKFALYILDKFISNEKERNDARKRVLAAMNDYNSEISDSSNIRTQSEQLKKNYLDSLKK